MTIYPDTSFLVSLLYVRDKGHAAAQTEFARHATATWLTSDWSLFETANSLRQLAQRHPNLPPAIPEALRRYFKHLHHRGPFERRECDLHEALRECHQISAACGTSLRLRGADVLHVALLEQINPDLFITRDKDQATLAVSRAFKCQLVP